MGAGTGGTLTGISRKLKEMNPDIKIVAVDPPGSILAQPEELNLQQPEGGMYEVEGIGYDFIPRVCDRTCTDEWMKMTDKPTFTMARKLIREEGMLCGGSSGSALAAAIKYIRDNKIGKGKRVVVVLPDNVRNYISKFLNNDWMLEKGFITEQECIDLNTSKLVKSTDWGQDYTVKDLKLQDAHFLKAGMTCGEAIAEMQKFSFDQFPVRSESGEIMGVVTSQYLTQRLIKNKVTMSSPIDAVV